MNKLYFIYKKYDNYLLMMIIFGVIFALFLFIITLLVNNRVNKEVNFYAETLVTNFDGLLNSGESVISELNEHPIYLCNRKSIDKLRALSFNHLFIKNIVSINKNTGEKCSSMKMAKDRDSSLLNVSPNISYNQVKYWFGKLNTIDDYTGNHIIMEKDKAKVSMINSYLNIKPYLKVQILFKDKVVSFSNVNDKNENLLNHKLYISREVKSTFAPFLIVVARNKSDINAIIFETVKSFYKLALFQIVLIFICLHFYMKKNKNSFRIQLYNGLIHDEFLPYFQPIIDTKTKKCVGAEVLTRWIRNDGKVISPDTFIPAAEQFGLMTLLTQKTINKTFKSLGLFLAQHSSYYISINLSLDDLNDDATYNLLMKETAFYELVPDQIRIELTERQFINMQSSIMALNRYRQAGYKIYLDDFGTGYSSLAYLKDLPLDTLKIDKVFVDNLGGKLGSDSLTKHIIDMAKTLNLELVAEGVETEEQSKHLQALGVNIMQGWLYSKALPAVDWILFCHIEMNSFLKDDEHKQCCIP